MKNLPICFILTILAAIASCEKDPDDNTFFPDAPVNPNHNTLLELVNNARTAGHNCGGSNLAAVEAVIWNDTLEQVAKEHSAFMHSNDKLSHTGVNGNTVIERVAETGYVALAVNINENLSKGGATEEEVIQIWLNSAEHCKNLMSGKVKEMGVGTSGPYWTLVMAAH